MNNNPTQNTHKILAITFLRLGATAFGGPAAHIAMMEEVVVRKYKWLTKEEFLDLLSVTNLIPGPNSTEMAIHVGYKLGGWRGLLLAGIGFILPAFLIVWGLAWFYVEFGQLPQFQSIFNGVKPIILAVIGQAVYNLSRSAIKDRLLFVLGFLAFALYLYGLNEIVILFFVATLNLILRATKDYRGQSAILFPLIFFSYFFSNKAFAQINEKLNIPIENLFWFFAKVGSVLFGSGYVLVAFLQSDLVEKYHWITQQQLIDAIAVGQFTPGPVFTTATFIGYLVSGNHGAIVATLGIFTPAFIFVALTAPILPILRKSKYAALILDGLNVASLSLMAAAAFILGKHSLINTYGIFAFVISLTLLIKFKINSVWLILVAGFLGYWGLSA